MLLHPLHSARYLGLLRLALLLAVPRLRLGRHGPQRAAQAVIADDFVHAQDVRGNAVTAQRAHVRVAAVPVQDPQHPCAQHIHQRRRVRAAVLQRARPKPSFEQTRGLQILSKKGQLTHRRGRAALVPANLHHASRRAHLHRLAPDLVLTHRVPPSITPQPA